MLGPSISEESKQNLGWGGKLAKVTRFVYVGFFGPEFPASDDKVVSLPPGVGRVPFTWEIYNLLSRDLGRSGCFCYTGCFLQNVN